MTLPANDRYILHQPTVLTTNFDIDFTLFDAADVTVYVDGVLQETGYSVSGTFTNGRSDDAQVIVASALVDVDVEIYGTRTPARANNYPGNNPNLAENLQRDMDEITSVQQEQSRDFKSGLKVSPQSPVVGPLVATLEERARRAPIFDETGEALVVGPNADEIANAQSHAEVASSSAGAASSSAATAATKADEASASATSASNSASAAATSATTATTKADEASASATSASNSASSASTAATKAGTSASTATTKAAEADTSASTASTKASEAVEARDKAHDWADEAEDIEVEVGQFSARHHAAKASEQRILSEAAGTAATNAQTAAETARDAATVNATAYDDVAAGLAATTIGDQFQVILDDEVVRYEHEAGPVATEVARYPSANYVFDRVGSGLSELSDYVAALARDENGRSAILVKKTGEVEMPATPAFTVIQLVSSELSGYAVQLGRDAAGRVPFGISSKTGNPIFKGAEVDMVALAASAHLHSTDIECWGDSLTHGDTVGVTTPYPDALAALLPSRTVNNRGLSGRTSLQVATAQGGVPSMLTVASNTIPASGSVSVTTTQNGNFSTKGNAGTLNFTGTLYGIHGTLAVDHNGTTPEEAGASTFTRTTAGAETLIPDHTPFIPDSAASARGLPVLWVGRNDVISYKAGVTNYDNDFILQNIEAMIAAVKPIDKRFIVLTVTEASWEYVGAASQADEDAFNSILALNYEIMRRWPANAIDVRKALVNSYDSGAPADVTAFGRNQIPPSLQQDGLHLNDAGYAIVAGLVNDFITLKGW